MDECNIQREIQRSFNAINPNMVIRYEYRVNNKISHNFIYFLMVNTTEKVAQDSPSNHLTSQSLQAQKVNDKEGNSQLMQRISRFFHAISKKIQQRVCPDNHVVEIELEFF